MSTEDTPPPFPERLRFAAHLFVAAMVLTWIVGTAPYPVAFAVIVTSGLAVAFAVLALIATRGVAQTTFLRVVLAAGGALALLSLVSSTTSLVFYPELVQRSQCEATAITSQALNQCEVEFNAALQDRLNSLLPGAS